MIGARLATSDERNALPRKLLMKVIRSKVKRFDDMLIIVIGFIVLGVSGSAFAAGNNSVGDDVKMFGEWADPSRFEIPAGEQAGGSGRPPPLVSQEISDRFVGDACKEACTVVGSAVGGSRGGAAGAAVGAVVGAGVGAVVCPEPKQPQRPEKPDRGL